MATNIQGIGSVVNIMVKVKKPLKMEKIMKEIFSKDKEIVKENTFLKMVEFT